MDENRLIEKLRAVEALFAGATTAGERDAAHTARERILERLQTLQREQPPVEHRFKFTDAWSRRVFIALLRRYGVTPYRYPRQRHTTVMATLPRRFVNETLWPEFEQLSAALRAHLDEVTERIVGEVLHRDASDAQEVPEPRQLPKKAD